MGYVRQIQAHGPPDQPPLMQKVIGLLKRGIQNKLVYGYVTVDNTINFLNIRTPKKFVVITLKFELCSSTIE